MSKVSQDLTRLYEKPGKRQFTDLLLRLAGAQQCRTVGLFWGGGGDSRMFAASGFDVLAVDNDESLAEPMKADGERHGYATFAGNARRVDGGRDFWHADFMNTPNPDNFQTLRHIAGQTRRWLAVTVATDHIKNPEMQGESIMATLPAWMTFAAEGFTLEYFGYYRRNAAGLRMWTAILSRRQAGKGTSYQVLPVQIAYSIFDCQRRYWGSRRFYRMEMLNRRWSPRNAREKAADQRRYLRKRVALPDRISECRRCQSPFVLSKYAVGRPAVLCSVCKPQAAKERLRRWYEEHHVGKGLTERQCPECNAVFSTVQFRVVCSDTCKRVRERRLERDRRRELREGSSAEWDEFLRDKNVIAGTLAAVSGTAAEAVKAA